MGQTLRAVDSALETSLRNNDAFTYHHLIKFERPKPATSEGKVARVASDYAHFTDSPHDQYFWDGSYDAEGNSTGFQWYRANKLIKIGSIQEDVEARATSMTMELSAVNINASVVNCTGHLYASSGGFLETDVDLVKAGFREGDKILIGSSGLNHGKYAIIDKFANNVVSPEYIPNTAMYIHPENGETFDYGDDSAGVSYTFTNVSEEIHALTSNKDAAIYSNYINREVKVYKAHTNPITGVVIGAPFLIFKGVVTQSSLKEDPTGDSKVSWSLSSHWGDFVKVQGRFTSDSFHRALDETGKPDLDAILKPEYVNDYGFMHSERAVNVLGVFQAEELRFKSVRRGGLAGLLGGKKVVEYYETVDREVDLRFNLAATYLPVVYGVQKVSSIPIFADIDKTQASEVYIAYALCEGEIGGIYDIHIDDNPTVCSDKSDSAARSHGASLIAANNVEVICYGLASKGDVLKGNSGWDTEANYPKFFNLADEDIGSRGLPYYLSSPAYTINADNNAIEGSGTGLQHQDQYAFTTPIDATFFIHTGKDDQNVNQVLFNKASTNSFKIQTSYFPGDPSTYWGSSHKLLDTAYVVGRFSLSEGEETIPEYSWVVKGTYINCYNYDFSYAPDPSQTSASASNFLLGDTVNLKRTDNDVTINSSVQIIDKWTFYPPGSSTTQTRFRWSEAPDLVDSAGNITQFYMESGVNKWYMNTASHNFESGSVVAVGQTPIASFSYTQNSLAEGLLTITLQGTPDVDIENLLNSANTLSNAYISLDVAPEHSFLVIGYDNGTNTISIVADPTSALILTQYFTGAGNENIYFSNLLKTDGTEASDNVYNGKFAIVTRFVNGQPLYQRRKIQKYDGTYKVVWAAEPFSKNFIPTTGDTYTIGSKDLRVSINPAMQVLDYITNTRYGKGLDIDNDIDLDSFLESGRLCDDQSKVVVALTTGSGAPIVGDVYEIRRDDIIAGDSTLIFQGTVESVTSRPYSGTRYEVEFSDCIGKLGYKWNDWRTYVKGDVIWGFDVVSVFTSATPGTLTQAAFLALADETSIPLTRISGTGAASITVDTARLGGLTNTNNLVRSYTSATSGWASSGYSLYDSDDVKYWKYLGWDEPEQRFVSRHQLNQVVNTNVPLFDNVNSMLSQFNGLMSYANGKYELDIKTTAPEGVDSYWEDGITHISRDDIIGAISLDDKGLKNSFNSISANIVDPQNKFGSRAISFFNSTYLKEDKGIRKQGNYALPGVSNYYNARTNVKQYLDESRYGITATFNLDPKGYLLLPGKIIKITYPRFAWEEKLFRIMHINLYPSGLVNISAREHNDAAYLIEYTDRSNADNLLDGLSDPNLATLNPPTGLTASQNYPGEIELSWTNTANYDPAKYNIEIYMAEALVDSLGEPTVDSLAEYEGNLFANATLLDTTAGTTYVHGGLGIQDLHVRFYWIRYVKPADRPAVRAKFSPYEPDIYASNPEGVEGQAGSAGDTGKTVGISSDALVFYYDQDDSLISPASATITAVSYNSVLTTWYELFKDGISTGGPFEENSDGTYSWTYIPPPNYNNMPDILRVEIREGGPTGNIKAQDQMVVFGLKAASNGITTSLTNDSHNLAVAADGSINYTGSGTDIEVLEGDQVLTPVVSAPSAGEFAVTVNAVNITAGAVSQLTSLGLARVADHIDMIADTAYIEYDLQIVKLNGTSVTIQRTQTFSKSIFGHVVRLDADDYTIVYNETGESPNPPSGDVLTATAQGFSVPQYRFLEDAVEVRAFNSTPTYSFNPESTHASFTSTGNPRKFAVEVREGAGPTVLATDSVSIHGVKDGTGAITIAFSNPSQGLPSTSAEVVTDFTNSGTEIHVWDGITKLDFDLANTTPSGATAGSASNKWAITSRTNVIDTEVTLGSITEGGADPTAYAIIGDLSGTWNDVADLTGYVEYKIRVRRVGESSGYTEFDIRQTFVKSVAGTNATFYYIKPMNGTAIKNGAGTLTVEAHKVQGGSDDLLSSGTIKLFVGATEVTSPPYAAGSDGYTGVFDAGDINGDVVVEMKDGAGGLILDTITLVDIDDGAAGAPGSAGADAVYGYIEALNDTSGNSFLAWTRDVDQTTWAPTDTTVDLNCTFVQGGLDVARDAIRITRTAGGLLSWSATSHPASDLNTTRLTITKSGNNSSAITIKFDYSYLGETASVAETVITSLSGEAGVDGMTIRLTNDNASVPTDSVGDSYANPDFSNTDTLIEVFEGGTELDYDGIGTAAGKWTVGTVTLTNCTGASISESGLKASVADITAISAATAKRSFPILGKRANGSAFSITLVQTLTRVPAGEGGTGETYTAWPLENAGASGAAFSATAYAGVQLDVSEKDINIKTSVSGYSDTASVFTTVGTVSDYDVRFALTGAFDNFAYGGGSSKQLYNTSASSTLNTWLALSVDRQVEASVSYTSPGSSWRLVFLAEFRKNSTGEIVYSMPIELLLDNEP